MTTAEFNDRCPPSPSVFTRQTKRCDERRTGQDGMNASPQVADPFAVYDAHGEYPPVQTGSQIIGYQLPDVARPESMEIKYAIYGNFYNLFIHIESPFS